MDFNDSYLIGHNSLVSSAVEHKMICMIAVGLTLNLSLGIFSEEVGMGVVYEKRMRHCLQ